MKIALKKCPQKRTKKEGKKNGTKFFGIFLKKMKMKKVLSKIGPKSG